MVKMSKKVLVIGRGAEYVMGEAKRKSDAMNARVEKYMNKQTHGVDVHVPSDTEQFDRMSQTELTPAQIERQNKVRECQERFTAYANFICNKTQGGAVALLMQAYIQSVFNEASQNTMNRFIMKKLGITVEEFQEELVKTLENNLFEMQGTMNIVITNQEVVVLPKDTA